MRILLTGAGGAAAISVWKSLGQEHQLYMGDIDPSAAGLYLVPEEQRLILPRGDAAQFVDKIFAICKEQKIELVIPTVDTELGPLAKACKHFMDAKIHLPLCSYEVLQICRDKYSFLMHCQKGNLPVPAFALLTMENRPSHTHFPYFAKPCLGAGGNGAFIIKTAQDLAGLPTDGSYLIQELLPGDEYSVDVYIDKKDQPIAAVPRLRMKIDSGAAVTARTQILPKLTELALKTAMHIGIRYVANIQFKASTKGEFKLLEINPRFPGTLPLTVAAGVDIPKLLIRDVLGESLPKGIMPYKEIMVVRYWTEHFFSPTEWEKLCRQN